MRDPPHKTRGAKFALRVAAIRCTRQTRIAAARLNPSTLKDGPSAVRTLPGSCVACSLQPKSEITSERAYRVGSFHTPADMATGSDDHANDRNGTAMPAPSTRRLGKPRQQPPEEAVARVLIEQVRRADERIQEAIEERAKLARAANDAGLSTTRLGRELGVGQTTVAKWIREARVADESQSSK